MAYNVKQEDWDVIFQNQMEIYIKFQILDSNDKILDEIQNKLISGSLSSDAQSDIRTTFTAQLYQDDDSLIIDKNKKLWFDKFIKVFLGIKNVRTQNIHYFPLGKFLFTDNTYTYDSVTSELSLTCLDLMSSLNGERNGQLEALDVQIHEGNNIRNVLISTVTQLGRVKKFIIEDIGETIPYDLQFQAGVHIYEILKEICNLYPGWEMYFDEDTFIFKKIPTCSEDSVVLDWETVNKLIISEERSRPLNLVKNRIVIWGRVLDSDYAASACSLSGQLYTLTSTNYKLENDKKIIFIASANNPDNCNVKVNSTTQYPLVDVSGNPLPQNTIIEGNSYILQYKDSKYYYCGAAQIYADAEDDNPDSPFYIGDNRENVVVSVLTGGDYDKIPSNDLAQQRADYELWKATRFEDSVVLVMKLVPWLGLNQKIEYKSIKTGEIDQYITKNISLDFTNATMTVTAIKFYPLYPNIIKNRQEDKNE